MIGQADDFLALSTIVICPTSTSAPPASFHPRLPWGDEPTLMLCEMVGAVDARAVGDQVGHLSVDETRAVDEALTFVLGLT